MLTLSINHFNITIIFFSSIKGGLLMFISVEFITYLKEKKGLQRKCLPNNWIKFRFKLISDSLIDVQ